MTEPPRAPQIELRLPLHLRRMAALVFLGVLPLASLAGGFHAIAERSAESAGLTLSVRYPTRVLYREAERLELVVRAGAGCAHAVVDGLAGYLSRFEEVFATPPSPTADRLYEGPLRPGEPLTLHVLARPVSIGMAHGTLAVRCDERAGPSIALTTFVFP